MNIRTEKPYKIPSSTVDVKAAVSSVIELAEDIARMTLGNGL
jgi:hypothetical protein